MIGGCGFCSGSDPRVDHAVLEVLALPAERPGPRPGGDDAVVRFLEALAVVGRIDVVGQRSRRRRRARSPRSSRPREMQSIIASSSASRSGLSTIGSGAAEHQDLDALGDLGQDRAGDGDRRLHAERRGVVLVDHDAVEAGLRRRPDTPRGSGCTGRWRSADRTASWATSGAATGTASWIAGSYAVYGCSVK